MQFTQKLFLNKSINNISDINSNTISFNIIDIELLLGMLTSEFCKNGLNNNDEPNNYGLFLEYLIDKIYIMVE
jgi:hypothetical protein